MSFGEREGGMSLQNDAIQPRNPSRRLAREVFSFDMCDGGTYGQGRMRVSACVGLSCC